MNVRVIRDKLLQSSMLFLSHSYGLHKMLKANWSESPWSIARSDFSLIKLCSTEINVFIKLQATIAAPLPLTLPTYITEGELDGPIETFSLREDKE